MTLRKKVIIGVAGLLVIAALVFWPNKPSRSDVLTVEGKAGDIHAHHMDFNASRLAFFRQHEFEGTWFNNNQTRAFGKFNSPSGKFKVTPLKNNSAHFAMYDGEFSDDLIYIVDLGDLRLDYNVTTVSAEHEAAHILEEKNLGYLREHACDLKFTATLDNVEDLSTSSFSVRFNFVSRRCLVNVSGVLSIDQQNFTKRVLNFVVAISIIALIQMYGMYNILKEFKTNPMAGQKYSMLSVMLMAVWDWFTSFLVVVLGMNFEAQWYLFVPPFILFFLCFSLFEAKIILCIWSQTSGREHDAEDPAENRLQRFQYLFYGAIIIMVLIIRSFVLQSWFLALNCLYFVPQIVRQARLGQPTIYNTNFIHYMGLPRFLIMVYFKGCPFNILNLRGDPETPALITILVAIQMVVLALQSHYDPKVIVPWFMKEKHYDWFCEPTSPNQSQIPANSDAETSTQAEAENSQGDCAICLNCLEHKAECPMENPSPLNKRWNKILESNASRVMKAPCSHRFHPSCLVNWMALKMECPTCRSPLPAL